MHDSTSKRAVIYCRVSTKEQVEDGNSLLSQEKICRDYASKNGFDVVTSFIEQGESAKTANRTQLQNLLEFCSLKKNRIHTVIFYKIDRFARQHHDYGNLKYLLLKKYGVSILSATEPIEDTPAGRFMENVIASVAQFDNDMRTERSMGGMRDAVRDGRYVWTAPLGYDNVKIAGKSTISPNKLAPLIKLAFELIYTGLHSVEEVHRMVTAKGLLTRSGNATFTSHFHTILRNELYAGRIHKFGEQHKGTFQPIISESLFDSVQDILKRRKRRLGAYKIENKDFPLRRFVQNSDKVMLTGCWSQGRLKKYPYYRFQKNPKSIKKEVLEESFQTFLNQFRFNETKYQELKKLLNQNLTKKAVDRNKLEAAMEKSKAVLKERQKLLIQKNIKGVIPDQILQEQLESIEAEIREIELNMAEFPVRNYNYERLLDKVSGYLKDPGKTWLNAPFEQKLKLQWFEFPQGVTFDGGKFRTKKIRSLFKAKDLFLPGKSTRVPSKEIHSNNLDIPETEEKEKCWQKLGNDLIKLNEILCVQKL